MIKKAVYFIFFINIFSCKNKTTTEQKVFPTIIELNEKTSEMIFSISLNDYPKVFLKEEGIEEWEDFEKLHESMSRISELNLRDVTVELLALSARLKNFTKKKFPEKLEVPQIRSRLKVVQMQADKSRYFSMHYKKDSLVPSLEKLYEAYNALLSRMLTLKDETVAVSSKTVNKD